MCVIIYKPLGAENPSDDVFRRADANNPDGWGVMARVNGEVKIYRDFGIKSGDSLVETVHELADYEYVVHTRIGTSGNKGIQNTHPFYVINDTWMVHNGIINIDDKSAPQYCDTYHYARFLAGWLGLDEHKELTGKYIEHHLQDEAVQTQIAKHIGASKLVFMTPNKTIIINDGKYSSFWKDGVWYSNDSALTTTRYAGCYALSDDDEKWHYGKNYKPKSTDYKGTGYDYKGKKYGTYRALEDALDGELAEMENNIDAPDFEKMSVNEINAYYAARRDMKADAEAVKDTVRYTEDTDELPCTAWDDFLDDTNAAEHGHITPEKLRLRTQKHLDNNFIAVLETVEGISQSMDVDLVAAFALREPELVADVIIHLLSTVSSQQGDKPLSTEAETAKLGLQAPPTNILSAVPGSRTRRNRRARERKRDRRRFGYVPA